ncbi:MAG: peptide chain release factor N(5)-glutamine methyltransferase [Ruminococcus sp.]|nr:peptide chain release factor N(5)-glutamine methyltransferase [Ruminococcus sp.]
MVNRSQLFSECRTALENSGIDTAHFDTLCIFQDMLADKNPLFKPQEAVPDDAEKRIRELIKKRSEGYPLQYLLGEWEFYGYPIKVGEGVLIPRPDTETLVDQVLEICRKNGMTSPKIADLCSGSGCIAIALKKQLPSAEVYSVELSDKALGYLRENIKLNNADITVIEGDVLKKETQKQLSRLDIIVSNPPYLTGEEMRELQTEVSHEPGLALYGGNDGLGFYRAITELWRRSLKLGGYIAYEFGEDQHDAVKKILTANSFDNIQFCRDGGGIIRTAAAQKIADGIPRFIDTSMQCS